VESKDWDELRKALEEIIVWSELPYCPDPMKLLEALNRGDAILKKDTGGDEDASEGGSHI